MTTEELYTIIQSTTPAKLSVTTNPDLLQARTQLLEQTNFLTYPKVPLALRFYCVLNHITEIPKCQNPTCNSPTRFNSAYPNKGFNQFCSESCAKDNKAKSKNFQSFLKDKEWLYHQRITLKKSKDLIAEELNCSITPVNKWLKFHEIPDVHYNESNTFALTKLKDYDYLYQEHVVNHRTCEDIGNELNVSKATVSVHLAKHNIQANETNSYDREGGTSLECMEIVDFIKTFYNKEIILNKRNIIGSLELDIYLPEDNLAIEYNGVYSHLYRPHETDFSRRKDAKYHLYKTEQCESKNIQLIHIFSGQWKSNKSVWKSFIKNKLNQTENKIYARQCEIKEVSINDKNLFLDENHIQGNAKSKIRFGLYYNDELISLITFGTPRYNKDYTWELIRFCNKANYSVVGGFSKLLKHFRNNYPGSIISYANRTYSNGNLYEKNGFELIKINPPSYWYVKKNTEILLHKTNFKKQKLLKELNEPTWTERQLSEALGYNIIFDCGTKVFVLN